MKIVLIGPPGVGKGTQSSLICDRYNLKHVSTGDILRKHIKIQTNIGKIVSKYDINKGNFVPDDLINTLIRDMYENGCLKQSYLLDGYPRNFNQALFYNNVLEKSSKYMVIYLNASRDYILGRIYGRRICINCGTTYNLKKNVPLKFGVCDNCGSELVQRLDDKYDIFNKRFELYHSLIVDVINYFDKLKVLFEVNASGEINDIFDRIEKVIGEYYG